MITAAVSRIHAAVWSRFAGEGLISWGVYNRRYIAGTQIWSQHAWGNAEDISVPIALGGAHRMRVLDDVSRFLHLELAAGRLPVRAVLWRVSGHFDHIHVDGSPKSVGIPPRLGPSPVPGPGRSLIPVLAEFGAAGEWVRPLQVALNEARAVHGGLWAGLEVDGRFGEMTVQAVRGYQTAAGLVGVVPKHGAIDALTGLLLAEYFRPFH